MPKFIAGIVISLLVACSTPAFAQTQPFQGLFGAPAGTAPQESLDLTASVFGVNDTNLPRLGRDLTQGDRTPDVRYADMLSGLWFNETGRAHVVRRQRHLAAPVLPAAGQRRCVGAGPVPSR